MKTKATLLLATLASWLAGSAVAAEVSLESAPPVVVKTFPAAGATDVDPALNEIKVTYSKVMLDGSWSWSTWGEENFPETAGPPHYEGDGHTCVLPVKLQPGKFYATWLNSDKFTNFKDTSGKPAVPYLLTFTTAIDAAAAKRANEVIAQSVETISHCAEGDPRVAEALTQLKTVPEAKVVSGVATYLDSSQDTIRRSAVYVLWRGEFADLGPAIAPLQKLLTHHEDLTRGMAALALGQNRVRESYDHLVQMTADDSSGYARRCAAYALGLLGDPRAKPILEQALKDKDVRVQNNAKTALGMLETAGPPASTADDSVLERTVDMAISDFPVSRDLSTPEGACAAWQRASARRDVKDISKMSLVPLDPRREEEWYRREEQRDPEGLKTYLKAIADSKILAVQSWRGELANVITLLAFPEGKGRHPYSSRCFGLVKGEWKNLGEDRLPTLDAARSNFNTKKEILWRHYSELKAKATTAENESDRKFVRVVLDDRRMTFEGEPANWKTLERLLAGVADRERTVLEWAVPSTRVTPEQHGEWTSRFAGLARKHGFEYSSYVGVHPLGSKGGAPPVGNKTAQSPVTDVEMGLLLNEDQKTVVAWTDRQFRSFFDDRQFKGWSEQERAQLELRLIDTLKGPQTREYYQAINTLGALHSTNALFALRAIAYDRADKDNRDRWMAIRALGMIGDQSDVPQLIRLVYHGNMNTRWWAQISLVRLTGQNFGSDWEGWGNWWNESGGRPALEPELIRWWSGQPETKAALKLALNERDVEFLKGLRSK